jgi:hypothetical protein
MRETRTSGSVGRRLGAPLPNRIRPATRFLGHHTPCTDPRRRGGQRSMASTVPSTDFLVPRPQGRGSSLLFELHDGEAVFPRIDKPGHAGKANVGDAVNRLQPGCVVFLDFHAS